MTEQRKDGNDGRLETLYRQAGDVEPEAGLDRIIRARAEEAVGSRRSSNRLPWLGGLATASVAIIAIAVVLQQAPPGGEPMPEAPVAGESGEPEAFMAPSPGADAALKSSADSSSESRRARTEAREMQAPGAGPVPPAPPAAPRAPAQAPSRQMRVERLGDIVADQASNVAEPERSLPEESTTSGAEADSEASETSRETTTLETIDDDPVAMLARIEALIQRGELQRARESFDLFRRAHPDHAVPEEIETALRAESGNDPN